MLGLPASWLKPFTQRLLWRLGSAFLILLILVLAAADIHAVRTWRRDNLRDAFTRLESLARLAEGRVLRTEDSGQLSSWAAWMSQSGTRVTVVATDGRVLADSSEEAGKMENHRSRPEIRGAFESGQGRAVRYSETLGRDLAYLAVRHQPDAGPAVVVRLALPLQQLDESVAEFRRRLWAASAVIFALAVAASLLFFRNLSTRVDRLKQFSRRVAEGDFRPMPLDRERDELAELSSTLNETAARLYRTIRKLTEERNQSAAILSSMTEGVAVIDSDQRITFCNASFCRALELEHPTLAGRPMTEAIRQPDLIEITRTALQRGETVQNEVVIGTVRTRSFAATAAPIGSADQTTGAVLVLHDITELRRLERARRDFVANVSHEFRTPLSVIQGFAETLLAGAIEDTQNRSRFLEIIRDHSLRLGCLTDDLLKLAQIEAGGLPLEARTVEVEDLVGPCLELTRLKAAAKGVSLEADLAEGLPSIRGDLGSLRQVVQNLLDNAVQYTPAGGRIVLRAAVRGKELVISVSDTGIGIPKAEQQRIFERFYRVDAARSRELGGTGLGLSIAKHLAEASGGRIKVESELGQGSTFSVFLPCA